MTRLLILFFLFLLASCGSVSRTEEAVNLNNMIVQKQDSLYLYLDALIELISQDVAAEDVEVYYLTVFTFSQKILKEVNALPPFDEEDDFRIQSVEFFSTQVNMLLHEFAQLLELYALPVSEITPEHEKRWDSLLFRVADIDSVAIVSFMEEQRIFANKYNFTLKESE
jgi:hypothetical protein